jgi:chromosome segregation protein
MQANLARVQDLTVELRRQLRPLGKQAEVAKKAATIQADLRDAKLRLLADDFINLSKTLDAEVADETALRARRSEVEAELETTRRREESLDAQSAFESPLLIQAQENFYSLSALREKFRGTQSLAQERSRFLAEEAEEARNAGRDPEALEREAATLRAEESALRASVETARAHLIQSTQELTDAEAGLKSEEDKIAAALRAIADQREGTARQEGHIKSLAARLDAIAEEISRLTKARDEAQARVDSASREYSTLEMEIAGADAGEQGLDSLFEQAKRELDAAKKKHSDLIDLERSTEREKNATESKLEAMRITSGNRDGGAALVRDSRGISILGSIASLIRIDAGWEAATASALGSLADAIVVRDLNSAVSALTTLRSENLGQADVLVHDGNSATSLAVPQGLTPLLQHIHTSEIDDLLTSLLATTVVANDARAAQDILRSHPQLTVVTRDGDVLTSKRVRGG